MDQTEKALPASTLGQSELCNQPCNDQATDESDCAQEPLLQESAQRLDREKPCRPHWYLLVHLSWFFISIICVGLGFVLHGCSDERDISQRYPIPRFEFQEVILQRSERHEVPSSAESNRLWSLDVPGRGFLLLKDFDMYNLPPGLPTRDNETAGYGVTWTHEHHCLSMVRQEFWNAIHGTSKLYSGIDEVKATLSDEDAFQLDHIQHCFDYLRQLIVCRADMTIEWAAPEPDAFGHFPFIDGWGIPHRCQKQEEIYEYMSQRQAYPLR